MNFEGRRYDFASNVSEAVFTGIEAVIFDFDGVVADSEILSLSSLKDALADFGIELSLDEVRNQFLGASLVTIIQFVLDKGPIKSADGFASLWQENLFESFRSKLTPIPGALDFIAGLSEHNIPFCVASSGTFERIGVALDAMDMESYFKHVFSAELVSKGKPAPDLFLYAAAKLGVAPEKCLVIEDAPRGIGAATAANMRSVGFLGGAHLHNIEQEHGARLKELGAMAISRSFEELSMAMHKSFSTIR